MFPKVRTAKTTPAALIAAAGDSSRMGFAKALLQYAGEPLVVRLAKTYLSAGCSPCVVTVPAGETGERIAQLLEGLQVLLCLNLAPNEGLTGSVRTALKHLSTNNICLALSPVDAPFLPSALLAKMLSWPDLRHRILVASFAQRPGHPIIFGRDFFENLADPNLCGGPRSVMEQNQNYVEKVESGEPGILENLNTPEDAKRCGVSFGDEV